MNSVIPTQQEYCTPSNDLRNHRIKSKPYIPTQQDVHNVIRGETEDIKLIISILHNNEMRALLINKLPFAHASTQDKLLKILIASRISLNDLLTFALMTRIYNENADLVLTLLQHGADPNNNPNAIASAAANGHLKSVAYMIDFGGRIDLTLDNTSDALYWAIHGINDNPYKNYPHMRERYIQMVEIMLKYQNEPISCSSLTLALRTAIEEKLVDIALLVIERASKDLIHHMNNPQSPFDQCKKLSNLIAQYGGFVSEQETRKRIEAII